MLMYQVHVIPQEAREGVRIPRRGVLDGCKLETGLGVSARAADALAELFLQLPSLLLNKQPPPPQKPFPH